MNRLLSYILSCLLVSSCVSHDELLDYALEQARSNRHEIEKVLTHYVGDTQKQEAARWLVANMPGHSVMWSEGVQAFADSVMHQGLSQERGNQLWDSLQKISATPQKQRDIETLSAEFLIDNIDKAFRAWSESPWKSEVDFDRFKSMYCHIVPTMNCCASAGAIHLELPMRRSSEMRKLRGRLLNVCERP